jgi:hypothetical protein
MKSPGNYSGTSAKVDNPYCWQVALQQSSLPLRDYDENIKTFYGEIHQPFLAPLPKKD